MTRGFSVLGLALGLALSGLCWGASLRSTPESVWVSARDGSKSCDLSTGAPLERGRAALIAAGVEVLEAKKETDGMMHIQMCGAESGQINSYRVPARDLQKAVALEFKRREEFFGP